MLHKFLNNFWVQAVIGVAVMVLISLIMFDAVAIGVGGRSLFFSYPK